MVTVASVGVPLSVGVRFCGTDNVNNVVVGLSGADGDTPELIEGGGAEAGLGASLVCEWRWAAERAGTDGCGSVAGGGVFGDSARPGCVRAADRRGIVAGPATPVTASGAADKLGSTAGRDESRLGFPFPISCRRRVFDGQLSASTASRFARLTLLAGRVCSSAMFS